MFVDTHCHVTDENFDSDRQAVIERATQAGVTTLIEIAESPDMWDAAVALAEKHARIYASLGIHPHHAHEVGPREWPGLSQKLREYLKRPKVVAIGEFGLDYYRMQNTQEQQQYLFQKQLDLAKEMNKPIVIHCREDLPSPLPSPDMHVGRGRGEAAGEGTRAHLDVQKRIKEYYPNASYARACPVPKGTIHCFSGTWADAQTYLAHGFVLGIDGPVTYPNSQQLKENVTRLPLERMVLETDSPYLPPQTHRGQRNEPAHVPAIAAAIGDLKHRTSEEVGQRTTLNAKALFRI
jgi:TatD DNase family protein